MTRRRTFNLEDPPEDDEESQEMTAEAYNNLINTSIQVGINAIAKERPRLKSVGKYLIKHIDDGKLAQKAGELIAENRGGGLSGRDLYSESVEGLASYVASGEVFDEIGKGNVALHNLMLSILREGELASARGDTTYFKNSFIFFTDNAGSEEIAERLRQKSGSGVRMGFDTTPAIGAPQQDDQEIYEIATRSLKKVFKIEFLNRINEIVVARPLSRDALLMLFGAERIKLRERFADQDCKITIEISDDVKDAMVDDALKKLEENASRLIKKFKSRIGDAIVRAYLTGQIKSGDRIKVTLKSGSTRKFLFQKIVEKKGKRKLAILSLSEPSG